MLEVLINNLKSLTKYLHKLRKEVRRKDIILFALCFAIINGLIYFMVEPNCVILIIFAVSSPIAAFEIIKAVSQFIEIKTKTKNKH